MVQLLLVQMMTKVAWCFVALCRQRYWDLLSSFWGAVLPRAVRILVHSKECSLLKSIALLDKIQHSSRLLYPFRHETIQQKGTVSRWAERAFPNRVPTSTLISNPGKTVPVVYRLHNSYVTASPNPSATPSLPQGDHYHFSDEGSQSANKSFSLLHITKI